MNKCECGWEQAHYRDERLSKRLMDYHKKRCLVFYICPRTEAGPFAITKDGLSKMYLDDNGEFEIVTDKYKNGEFTITLIENDNNMPLAAKTWNQHIETFSDH